MRKTLQYGPMMMLKNKTSFDEIEDVQDEVEDAQDNFKDVELESPVDIKYIMLSLFC